jgi:hypothetical protein
MHPRRLIIVEGPRLLCQPSGIQRHLSATSTRRYLALQRAPFPGAITLCSCCGERVEPMILYILGGGSALWNTRIPVRHAFRLTYHRQLRGSDYIYRWRD